jgi:hypothetical protein
VKRLLLTISIAAFLLRLGYAIESGAIRHPQTWEQERIATNLIEHHEFSYRWRFGLYRAYAEPLYPFLAAAVYLVTGHSQTALVLVQLLIASGMVWMTGWAAELATGSTLVSAIAALLAAIHPGLIQYSSILHPFVLDSFFFIAAAAMLVRYRQSPTLGRGLAAAAVIGLGALTRPTILVFLLPLSWIRPKRAIVLAAAALAVVAPWTIRNAVVLHHFLLTRSAAGYPFWIGNNPNATGAATDRRGQTMFAAAPPELRARIVAADEITRGRIFRDEAWKYVKSDPAAAVWRVLQRVYYFWWFSPEWGIRFSRTLKIAYQLWWGFLLLLIAIGAMTSRNRDVWLMAACALLISLVQSLYYVEGRHRLAIEPLLFPLAALGVVYVWSRIRANIGSSGR